MQLITWKLEGQSPFLTYYFWWQDEEKDYLYTLQWGDNLTRRILLYDTEKGWVTGITDFMRIRAYKGLIESPHLWNLSLWDLVGPLSTDPVSFLAELVL